MVQGTYNIKINMLSQDNTNVQTTSGEYKTEDYKRSERAVVLNVMNYFGQYTISASTWAALYKT
jgi:predicted membrane protein